MNRVSVIGAGTMGNGIAHLFAQYGFEVNLIDVSADQLNNALATITKNLDRQVAKGALTPAAKEETLEEVAHRLVEQVYATKVPTRFALYCDILSALRNEREACAKVADTFQIEMLTDRIPALKAQDNTAKGIAAAIRGRTE